MTTSMITTNAPPRIHPQSLADLQVLADTFSQTGLAPAPYRGKPADALLALLFGNACGLSPAQALLNVQMIQGKPCLTADATMAIVRACPEFEDLVERVDNPGTTNAVAVVTAKRRGCSPITATFSVKDAQAAGLWGRGCWKTYPDRMLRIRARGFALRDLFADVLAGFWTEEEARDIPASATPDEIIAEPADEVVADTPAQVSIVEAARVAIASAATEATLDSIRDRLEERVLQGRLAVEDGLTLRDLVTARRQELLAEQREEAATDE